MGLYANVTIRNPADEARSWQGRFLVGSGVIDSIVPRPHLEEIGLSPTAQKTCLTTVGRAIQMDFTIGQIVVMGEITGGRLFFGAPDAEPVLGMTAQASAGIEIDPQGQTLRKLPTVRLKCLEESASSRHLGGAVR